MAAALLSKYLEGKTAPPRIPSAGTAALVGEYVAPEVATLLGRRGVDVSGHRARQVDYDILRATDLVLAAETGHMRWIKDNFPFMQGRVHLLGRWQGEQNVADPYRKEMPAYERALKQLDACVQDWLERL